jgi:transposase
MARPKKAVDPDGVIKLASYHCTTKEIAAFFDVSTDTIQRRFAAQLEKGYEIGKIQLRKGLWELAAKHNLGALIWLSKQHLGMSEKTESKVDANISASAPQLTVDQIKDLLKKKSDV